MTIVKRAVDAYRWRRLLGSCDLDPSLLARPVPSPSETDFVVTGCPRTGTSLLAAQLFQPPRILTVMEPWDGLRLPPKTLFDSLRAEIHAGELRSGRLNIDALKNQEVVWESERVGSYPVEADTGFLLGVKWPAFWRYLELLPETRFLVTVRHPLEVIHSFDRMGGRLSQGLDYDVPFNREMNTHLRRATDEDQMRRVLMYEYINSRLIPFLNRRSVMVVRYERWFGDREALLAEISEFLNVPLELPIAIFEQQPRSVDPNLVDLIRTHAPSARSLGYEKF